MSVREWADEEIFLLISLYEEQEFLWNVKHNLHRNREKKLSMYAEFASKFKDCDVNEIQRKIHNLRNQVAHEVKKMKKMRSGDDANDRYESKWKFFTALQFIVPSFTATSSNTSNMNNTEESSESLQNEETQSLPTSTPIPTRSKRRRQTDDYYDILKEPMAVRKNSKDDFDRFGEYVALELKTLRSDFYRGKLKSEIRKAIARITDIDEKTYWSSAMSLLVHTNCSPPSTPGRSPTYGED